MVNVFDGDQIKITYTNTISDDNLEQFGLEIFEYFSTIALFISTNFRFTRRIKNVDDLPFIQFFFFLFVHFALIPKYLTIITCIPLSFIYIYIGI